MKQQFRVALVTIDDNTSVYRCEDLNINAGDFVKVEDYDEKVKVISIEQITSEDEDTLTSSMKWVLEKVGTNKPKLKIIALVGKEFSYAEYHTDCLVKVKDHTYVSEYSLIKKLKIVNESEETSYNIHLDINFSNGFLTMDSLHLTHVEARSEVVLRIPFLKIVNDYLFKIDSVITSTITFSLYTSTNELIDKVEYPFNILPICQPSLSFNNDVRLFAKYILPLMPCVKQITLDALKYHDNKPFIAYQNRGSDAKNLMLKEIEALYLTIHDLGIIYQNPPALTVYNLAHCFQRLRLPNEIVNDKKGTCLDLSMFFCSCIEEIGYHPILINIDHHAFVGVFLEEKAYFDSGIEKMVGKIYNKAVGGLNEIALIETTVLSSDQAVSFEEAMQLGKENIRMYTGDYFNALDINFLHQGVFTSVPLDITNEELTLLLKPQEINERLDKPIVEANYLNFDKKEEFDRFKVWETRLLDLTERNPLVNFKLKLSNSVKVIANSAVADIVFKNENLNLKVINLENDDTAIKNFEQVTSPKNFNNIFNNDNSLYALGYDVVIRNLIKKSASAVEETGAPTLYLCLGVLTYNSKKKISKNKTLKGHAPFMVLPVKLTKERTSYLYNMTYDLDDLMLNQTFFEYYKQENPEADFSFLYGVSASQRYNDIVYTFKHSCEVDIELDENTFYLANLTFAHYIMWKDMRTSKESFRKHPIIESIIENQNLLEDDVITNYEDINQVEQYMDFAAPLAYDSTQLKAILECGNGKSFILDGPPGTGKSQTIVNMIVNAFYHHKTVLFVAEKKAALDVVSDRLRKLGDPNTNNNLGRFCLELHSNKANKTSFFSKIKSSMELGAIKDEPIFKEKCVQIEEHKQTIIHMMNLMHEKKYHYSLYDAIMKLEELSYLKNYSYDFSCDYLENLGEMRFTESEAILNKYIFAASQINNFQDSPVRSFNLTYLNLLDKKDVLDTFKNILDIYQQVLDKFNSLCLLVGIKYVHTPKNLLQIMDVFKMFIEEDFFKDELTNNYFYQENNNFNTLIKTAKDLITLENNDLRSFDPVKLMELDPEFAIEELQTPTNFIKKIFIKNKYKKVLKDYLKDFAKLPKQDLLSLYIKIKKHNELTNYLKNNADELNQIIKGNFFDKKEQFNEISIKYQKTIDFLSLLKEIKLQEDSIGIFVICSNFSKLAKNYVTDLMVLKTLYKQTRDLLDTYLEKETLLTKYQIDYHTMLTADDALDDYLDLLEFASNNENFDDLMNMVLLNNYKKKIIELGLEPLLNDLLLNKFNFRDFTDIYELSLANGFLKLYFSNNEINFFSQTSFEETLKEYKNLINEYNNLIITTVSSNLTKDLLHNSYEYAASSPLGKFKKLVSKNGRGTSIREALLEYDDIIRTYFPCFLMSPLSAAQYLSVDEEGKKAIKKFDLVIFDEASQIPTHEAIGPIARGKALIVAGDPEQMPPTTYFMNQVEFKGEDIKYDDAESLLDECLAIDLPRIRLAYHYRSKHESLINFSNHNFYNDNLYTFPSPYAKNSFVEFNLIELKNQKEDSSISPEEIKAICDKFKEIYTNPLTKNKSLGIIVFNINQQEKLSDAIEDLLAKDDELNMIVEEASTNTKEPWFVKSIENVQGDERDIIILSVGFRKNASGRAVVIGPITRQRGERRLNVAVSRSKEKMIVMSTIRYTNFDEDSEITNRGQLLLKQFLKYAEESAFGGIKTSENNIPNLTTYLKIELEKRGFKVASNVGNSVFKVDLAILNNQDENKDQDQYELGILLDNKNLDQHISCRDRIYVHEYVLNGLKWKIIRIYALEFFKNKEACIRRIIEALNKPYTKEETNNHFVLEQADKTISYQTIPYRKVTNLETIDYNSETGYSNNIYNNLEKILQVESPIPFEMIKERIKEYSTIHSMSAKAQSRLMSALKEMPKKQTTDQTQTFYWSKDSTTDMKEFRVGYERDINDISKEEIAAAMRQVLYIQVSLDDEDLYAYTLAALGLDKVLNRKNLDRLKYVHMWLKEKD